MDITPADAEVKRVVDELQIHPEFALSRREIVKYIITPPGRRSEDVQTLLRLDQIEKWRKAFTTFGHKRKNEADEAGRARGWAETELKTTLHVDRLDQVLVLKIANEKRQILGLPAIETLDKNTSFKAGVAAPQAGRQARDAQSRRGARFGRAEAATEAEEPADLAEHRQAAQTALEKLRDDQEAEALQHARLHGFIQTGLDLVTENACPLCDTPWQAGELREHLRQKLLAARICSPRRFSRSLPSSRLPEKFLRVEKTSSAQYGAASHEIETMPHSLPIRIRPTL